MSPPDARDQYRRRMATRRFVDRPTATAMTRHASTTTTGRLLATATFATKATWPFVSTGAAVATTTACPVDGLASGWPWVANRRAIRHSHPTGPRRNRRRCLPSPRAGGIVALDRDHWAISHRWISMCRCEALGCRVLDHPAAILFGSTCRQVMSRSGGCRRGPRSRGRLGCSRRRGRGRRSWKWHRRNRSRSGRPQCGSPRRVDLLAVRSPRSWSTHTRQAESTSRGSPDGQGTALAPARVEGPP